MQAHTIFFYTLWSIGGRECLNSIETDLYITKYNEINKFHSGVQKHVSYTRSHKSFLIY